MQMRDKPERTRRRLDRLKNVLIVLLSVSALFLMSRTDYFGIVRLSPAWLSSVLGFLQDGGAAADVAEEGEAAGLTDVCIPAAMAVTSADGGHYGLRYDGEALKECFGRFSASLGSALGSSGEPAAVTEREFKMALSGEGVFFAYTEALPLHVLAEWLGTAMVSEAGLQTARRLCLAKDGDGLSLFFMDARDGRYYACKTKQSFSSLSAWLEAFSPNGAYFAWERAAFPGLDPYFLILEEMPALHTLGVANPFRGSLTGEGLLSVFEMNSFTAIPYTESDGTVVYVEGDCSLRLYPSGRAVFRQSGGERLSAGGLEASDAVNMALRLAKAGVGARCGAAGLYLSELHQDPANGGYTVSFDYAVDGIPVLTGAEHAVTAVIRGGVVTRVSMSFQEFTRTDGFESPLPMRLAAAIAAGSGGGEPMLVYYASPDGVVGLGWVYHS